MVVVICPTFIWSPAKKQRELCLRALIDVASEHDCGLEMQNTEFHDPIFMNSVIRTLFHEFGHTDSVFSDVN
jgi:Zn-dependent oligopeptidase